jgi:hypothetical protein
MKDVPETTSSALGLTDDQFDLADAVEIVMAAGAAGRLRSPSEIKRKLVVPAEAHEVRAVLEWMERHAYVTTNERRGAWRRFASAAYRPFGDKEAG